jgi:hypothetical protein
MTLANRDIFYRDPTEAKIPNDGVTKIIRPRPTSSGTSSAGS